MKKKKQFVTKSEKTSEKKREKGIFKNFPTCWFTESFLSMILLKNIFNQICRVSYRWLLKNKHCLSGTLLRLLWATLSQLSKMSPRLLRLVPLACLLVRRKTFGPLTTTCSNVLISSDSISLIQNCNNKRGENSSVSSSSTSSSCINNFIGNLDRKSLFFRFKITPFNLRLLRHCSTL